MIQYRLIIFVVGVLLSITAGFMMIPLFVGWCSGDSDWIFFALSAMITGFFGIALTLACKADTEITMGIRETFLLTVMSWIFLCLFSSLPFFLSDAASFTDSLFEAVSGLTTTGATIFSDLNYSSSGILLWRALLQWLGGIGIVVMALAILPILKIGGMQLVRSEFSDRSEKFMPRITQVTKAILLTYIIISFACALSLWCAGMKPFDALCNMMSTVSTAGFSTSDASIGVFENPIIEAIIIIFMLIGGSTLLLFTQLLRGDIKPLLKDSQTRHYFFMILSGVIIMTCWLWLAEKHQFWTALRYGAFTVVSIITTTGFTITDYSTWGSFALICLLLFMFVGGCTGSTSGGIKIFRFQILFQAAKLQIYQLRRPHGIFVPIYNYQPIGETAFVSVLAFFALYIFCYCILVVGLSLCDLDLITCLSGGATILGNVGPGLGPIIGPSGNFSILPDFAKWLIMAGMIVGRLELLTFLILFTPTFWKN